MHMTETITKQTIGQKKATICDRKKQIEHISYGKRSINQSLYKIEGMMISKIKYIYHKPVKRGHVDNATLVLGIIRGLLN